MREEMCLPPGKKNKRGKKKGDCFERACAVGAGMPAAPRTNIPPPLCRGSIDRGGEQGTFTHYNQRCEESQAPPARALPREAAVAAAGAARVRGYRCRAHKAVRLLLARSSHRR